MTSSVEEDTKPINGAPYHGGPVGNGGETSNNDQTDTSVNEVEAAAKNVETRWAKRVAKRRARSSGMAQLTDAKLDGIDAKERLTLRKALRKKNELTDPNAHLTKTFKRHRRVSWVLWLGVAAGIIWTSYGVAHALGGPNPQPIFYLVEPLFSVPLLVIVYMQIVAAENGRLGKLKPIYRRPGDWLGKPTITGIIEMSLLAITVLVNCWPTLTAPEFKFEEFATRAFAPMMVVIFVLLQLVASELFSGIIRDARIGDAEGELNLRRQAERGLDLALEVRRAMEGDNPLPTSPDTGLPSITQISKRFPGEKVVAQIAHDALARFQQERKEVS